MKKDKEFSNILNDCLERILFGGETIEQCLKRYPEHAAKLDPLIRTSISAKEALSFEPSTDFRARSRYQFNLALQKLKVRAKGRMPALRMRPRWALAVALVLVLMIGGAGTVYAAESSMPDSPLYPIKLATEQVGLALTASSVDKAEYYAMMADKRVEEISYLVNKGKTELVEEVTRRLNTQLKNMAGLPLAEAISMTVTSGSAQSSNNGQQAEDKEEGDVQKIIQLKLLLGYYATNHPERLNSLLGNVPESVKPALIQAINQSRIMYQQAIRALEKQASGSSNEQQNNGGQTTTQWQPNVTLQQMVRMGEATVDGALNRLIDSGHVSVQKAVELKGIWEDARNRLQQVLNYTKLMGISEEAVDELLEKLVGDGWIKQEEAVNIKAKWLEAKTQLRENLALERLLGMNEEAVDELLSNLVSDGKISQQQAVNIKAEWLKAKDRLQQSLSFEQLLSMNEGAVDSLLIRLVNENRLTDQQAAEIKVKWQETRNGITASNITQQLRTMNTEAVDRLLDKLVEGGSISEEAAVVIKSKWEEGIQQILQGPTFQKLLTMDEEAVNTFLTRLVREEQITAQQALELKARWLELKGQATQQQNGQIQAGISR